MAVYSFFLTFIRPTKAWIMLLCRSDVVIEKPEWQVYNASHYGSKQQYRSPDEITFIITIRTYNQLFTRFACIVKGHSPRSLCWDHSSCRL